MQIGVGGKRQLIASLRRKESFLWGVFENPNLHPPAKEGSSCSLLKLLLSWEGVQVLFEVLCAMIWVLRPNLDYWVYVSPLSS